MTQWVIPDYKYSLSAMPLDLSVFHDVVKAIENRSTDRVTSLSGSSGALLLSLLDFPCLILCPSEESARELCSDALFWSGVLGKEPPVCLEPKDSPGHIKSLSSLYAFLSPPGNDGQGKAATGKFIAPVDAALSTLWPPEKYPRIFIEQGDQLGRELLIEELQACGYLHVPVVSGPGEMSIRGGILDIFPPEADLPARIEFFGDEIESLRFFDVATQLSVRGIKELTISPLTEPEEGPDLFELFSDFSLILYEPDDVRQKCNDLDERLGDRYALSFTSFPIEGAGVNCPVRGLSGFGLLRDERQTVYEFVKGVQVLAGQYRILMVCSSEGQARRLRELFDEQGCGVALLSTGRIPESIQRPSIVIGELSRGFAFQDVIVLSSTDIFGPRPLFRPARKSRVSNLISSIEEFKKGDYVVHREHGIGIFSGIKRETVEGHEDDFAIIEYLGGDRVFVPLERINAVQKFHAPENSNPKIDRLGGKTWQKTRKKVQKKIRDMAEQLLKIYARRTKAEGHAFAGDTELHREFDGFFPYEETPDQLTSIQEIKHDMEQQAPMERLLCGDVGYGKTEVVMRACFKAAYDGKQVALLVPTTILAEQHFETFVSRFSAFPIKIDYLSRFKSRAEQRQTVKALSEGGVDIVIGTHRLLVKDVHFYDLGLLVIDEEHKFGVAHKEKIKAIKANVDMLALSATPIPRTLHMALSGIRAMSTIETPPEERLAVKSTVARFNPSLIREVLQHELDRGGQAFFVHNRIHDIYEMGNFLQDLVPESKIGVAHGRMKEAELELVMHKFFHRETNVLVSTAIIGSGLDIPSANTIIINNAERFGLADLYQLRGRVGRSNVRAYAYFLIPGEDIISGQARKKLQAIQELSYLGAGFRLALKDLEIRGAGNLLGAEQSGHIEAVGFDMYMEMLESAVSELKGEATAPRIETEIDLAVPAIISEEYIQNPDIRLSIYRKISSAKDIGSIHAVLSELRDRFGAPPEETKTLIAIMELRVMAGNLLMSRIINLGGKIKVIFAPETPVRPEQIFDLQRTRKGYIKFLPEGGFELDMRRKKWSELYAELKAVIHELGSDKREEVD